MSGYDIIMVVSKSHNQEVTLIAILLLFVRVFL
jgi:hypothetical protein